LEDCLPLRRPSRMDAEKSGRERVSVYENGFGCRELDVRGFILPIL